MSTTISYSKVPMEILQHIAQWVVVLEHPSRASLKRLALVDTRWWWATRTLMLRKVALRGQSAIAAANSLLDPHRAAITQMTVSGDASPAGPSQQDVANAANELLYSTPRLQTLVVQRAGAAGKLQRDAVAHQLLGALSVALHVVRQQSLCSTLTHLCLEACRLDWQTLIGAARNAPSLHTLFLSSVVLLRGEDPPGAAVRQAPNIRSLSVAYVRWDYGERWHLLATTFSGVTALALTVSDFSLSYELDAPEDLVRYRADFGSWFARAQILEVSVGENGNEQFVWQALAVHGGDDVRPQLNHLAILDLANSIPLDLLEDAAGPDGFMFQLDEIAFRVSDGPLDEDSLAEQIAGLSGSLRAKRVQLFSSRQTETLPSWAIRAKHAMPTGVDVTWAAFPSANVWVERYAPAPLALP